MGQRWIVAVSVPHTLVMVMWEVACAVTMSRVAQQVAEVSKVGDGPRDRMLLGWGPWIAAGYFAAVPMQLATMGLSLCVVRESSLEGAQELEVRRSRQDFISAREKAKEAVRARREESDYDYAC